MAEPFAAWIGREETQSDVATAAPLVRLAAMFDHAAPPWRDSEVPPLGHWLYFLPRALQRDIGQDGHPHKGGFLPPVELPRRMWAGSRVMFHAPVAVGEAMTRCSVITAVEEKHGRSGALVFVTARRELGTACGLCITEEQDIVYREAAVPVDGPAKPAIPAAAAAPAEFSRTIRPDPVLLFRYSALTFNAHRIHYDRSFCRDVEGYGGLVVHGPLTATLLVDLFLRQRPGARVTSFSFRGLRPLFDTHPFTVCGTLRGTGADLWAVGPDGHAAMTATVEAQ